LATYYVDPSATSNGSGTELSPFNVLPANFSGSGFLNGDVFLLKRNTTYNIEFAGTNADYFTVNRSVTFDAYGTGAKPIITANYTGTGGSKLFRIYSNSCSFTNIAFQNTFYCFPIYVQNAVATFSVKYCSFNNIRGDGVQFHNAITIGATAATTGVTIMYNTFDTICNDAMVINCSDRLEIAYNDIRNVSIDAPNGDCIAVSGDCALLLVHDNICHKSNKDTKQCFIQDGGTNTGYALIYNNIFEGYFGAESATHTGVYLSLPGKVYRNTIKAWRSACFAAGPNIKFESNLIIAGGGDPTSGAIWSTQTSLEAYNNTIIMLGAVDVAKAAISISQSNANIKFKNNLIIGFTRGIVKGTLAVESNNAFWNVSTPVADGALAEVTKDVTDIVSNPLISPTFVPKASSPLIAAGASITSTKDRDQNARKNIPTIGAYEYVVSRADAGTRDTR